MSEPVTPPPAPRAAPQTPELPEPFDAEPRRLGGPEGCGKAALFGCGGLLLVLGIVSVVFVVKADEMLVWLFGRMQTQVEAALPADLPEAERERLGEAFAAFYESVEEGRLDPAALQRLQGRLLELTSDLDEGLTRDQVRDLTEALDRAAGVGEEPDEREPSPTDGAGAATALPGVEA